MLSSELYPNTTGGPLEVSSSRNWGCRACPSGEFPQLFLRAGRRVEQFSIGHPLLQAVRPGGHRQGRFPDAEPMTTARVDMHLRRHALLLQIEIQVYRRDHV